MHYLRFMIQNYRAIRGPVEVEVERNRLIPIIGVNECGKTTVLHAIFAFDPYNDDLNDDGRHLKDTANLYDTKPPEPVISADIGLCWDELANVLRSIAGEDEHRKAARSYLRNLRGDFGGQIRVARNLKTRRFSIVGDAYKYRSLNHKVAEEIVSRLPYILYFDDFRDSIDEKIEIRKPAVGWLSIMQRLFQKTDPGYSVYDLEGMEERQRKSTLAHVKRELNRTLTKEWHDFRLDDREALQVSIDYLEQEGKKYLKLEVVETDVSGNDHYFFVRDRSKGFYWFFNFVMKLEFNPKVLGGGDNGSIYLLDEPGSYLHASAQKKLCAKLKGLSLQNTVVYCTHSHYLLDPSIIPLNCVRIADKDGKGDVRLLPLHQYPGALTSERSPFQPIVDALHIRPLMFDHTEGPMLLVEGITDYYAFDMFRGKRAISVLPSRGASSIAYFVSLMIAWRVDYRALWDNDDEGRKEFARAVDFFGEHEARGRFFVLPELKAGKCILQNLFASGDIEFVRKELAMSKEVSFDKMLAALYYSERREDLIAKLTGGTSDRFSDVFKEIGIA